MEKTKELTVKRIFISYSWTSDDYVTTVRELALELAAHGMEVELDQWSLKDGANKFVYMESMVIDKSIDKVLILLDKKYQEKADGKAGGVGTEATIMTPEVYAEAVKISEKQKFLPVIMERDLDTKEAFIPVFLAGKKYTDLSGENYEENFEQLVRAIHDKPRHTKPVPGRIPDYLLDEVSNNLGTAGRARRAIDFLRQDKEQARNSVKEYFSMVIENLNVFDFPHTDQEVHSIKILDRIEEMTPARNEIVDVIIAIALYRSDAEIYEVLHDFLESLVRFFEYRREPGESNHQWAADHYKFFGHELFLYSVAALLKHKRFEQLNQLTEQGYVQPNQRRTDKQQLLPSYIAFNRYSDAFQFSKNSYYDSISEETRLLKQRAIRRDINHDDLKQADFILYLIHIIDSGPDRVNPFLIWYPFTLSGEYQWQPFEHFLRSQSESYFEKFRKCLRNISKEQLAELVARLKEHKESHNSWRTQMPVEGITGIQLIGTRP